MVKTLPSSGWGVGSIPGWGTKDSHAIDWDQKLFVFFFSMSINSTIHKSLEEAYKRYRSFQEGGIMQERILNEVVANLRKQRLIYLQNK